MGQRAHGEGRPPQRYQTDRRSRSWAAAGLRTSSTAYPSPRANTLVVTSSTPTSSRVSTCPLAEDGRARARRRQGQGQGKGGAPRRAPSQGKGAAPAASARRRGGGGASPPRAPARARRGAACPCRPAEQAVVCERDGPTSTTIFSSSSRPNCALVEGRGARL